MKVERMKWITRNIVRANPDKLFLFGDNVLKTGFGGQAKEMRGEPNAIGIPTKETPSRHNDAYWTDAEFNRNTLLIDAAFDEMWELWSEILMMGDEPTIVIPSDGLGTGLAELDKRAPKTFAYLQDKIDELDQ